MPAILHPVEDIPHIKNLSPKTQLTGEGWEMDENQMRAALAAVAAERGYDEKETEVVKKSGKWGKYF